MLTPLEALPEQVRIHVLKMRELARTIETAPVNEVVTAVGNLKTELDTLMTIANKAAGRRF